PLPFALFAEDDARVKQSRGLFEREPAVRRVEERRVVLRTSGGGRFEVFAPEALDGEDRERERRVAVVRIAKLVGRGPGGQHARARVVLREEARGVSVEQHEVAVCEVLLPGEVVRRVHLATVSERGADERDGERP